MKSTVDNWYSCDHSIDPFDNNNNQKYIHIERHI